MAWGERRDLTDSMGLSREACSSSNWPSSYWSKWFPPWRHKNKTLLTTDGSDLEIRKSNKVKWGLDYYFFFYSSNHYISCWFQYLYQCQKRKCVTSTTCSLSIRTFCFRKTHKGKKKQNTGLGVETEQLSYLHEAWSVRLNPDNQVRKIRAPAEEGSKHQLFFSFRGEREWERTWYQRLSHSQLGENIL